MSVLASQITETRLIVQQLIRGTEKKTSKLPRFWCWVDITVDPSQKWRVKCFLGPLSGYVKLRVAHVPGMPGTFSSPPWVSDPDMNHCTCITHVPWCMPGSLNSGFLLSLWRGKCSRHSRCMRNPQFYASDKSMKRSMSWCLRDIGRCA